MSLGLSERLGAQVFKEVKPFCVELSQLTFDPELTTKIKSPVTARHIAEALKQLDAHLKESVLEHTTNYDDHDEGLPTTLADYVFVPITELLKLPNIGDTELEFILSIINTLIESCWSSRGVLPKDLTTKFFPLFAYLLGGPPNESQVSTHSDETLLNGVHCIQSLLLACQNQGTEWYKSVIEDGPMMPCVGHIISVLLEIASNCVDLNAQRDSLETLRLFYQLLDDGEILSFVLPGTLSSVAKIMRKKPHYEVSIKCLEVIQSIICCCFNDADLKTHNNREINSIDDLKNMPLSETADKSEKDIKVFIPENPRKSAHRTTSWLRATSFQLEKALKLILKIDPNQMDRYSVRQALFDLILSVLTRSFKSCEMILPILLDSLTNVCCQDTMFQNILVSSMKYSHDLVEFKLLIEGSLNKGIDTLASALSSPDASKSKLLIDRLSFLTSTLQLLDSLDDFICQRLVFKLNDELTFLLQLSNSTNSKKKIMVGSLTSVISKPKKSIVTESMLVSADYFGNDIFTESLETVSVFEGILDSEVESSLFNLFKSIAVSDYISSALDELISNTTQNNNINDALGNGISLWLSTTILSLRREIPKTEEVVDEWLQFNSDTDSDHELGAKSDEETDLPVAVTNNVYSALEQSYNLLDITSTSAKDTQGTVQTTLLALQTISHSCKILGPAFQDELVDYLYPVIDNLASTNPIIRQEAQTVATTIANQLYAGSVKALIHDNADYLVDAISNRLTGDTLTPRTPIVLGVLIKIGGIQILSQLRDLIVTIFTLLDLYHGYSGLVEGFLEVFGEVIDQIYNFYFKGFDWEKYQKDLEEDSVEFREPWGTADIEGVFEFLNRKNVLPEALLNDDDGDSDDEDEDNVPDEMLKRNKFLEIDSDDESDTDRSELESINTDIDTDPDKQHADNVADEEEKWESPLDPEMYNTVLQIFTYAERLSKSKSVGVTLSTLNLMNKIIPILATQRNKLLPIVAQNWSIVVSFLLASDDFRVLHASLDVLTTFIEYSNTFLTSRVIDLYEPLTDKLMLKKLFEKQNEMYRRRKEGKTKQVVNQTSTSINWDAKLYNVVAEFLRFTLVKFGRFIPTGVANDVAKLTLPYNDNEKDYGYHDDLVVFLRDYGF